jgi:hypothetical protein
LGAAVFFAAFLGAAVFFAVFFLAMRTPQWTE